MIDLQDTDKLRYFAVTEFNNCFIIRSYLSHFLTAQGSYLPCIFLSRKWFQLRMSRIISCLITSFSSPQPTILLACGRNRELWEQPSQACAADADCVKPDGQNSVISFVISKWLLPELSFSDRWLRGTRLWERDCDHVRVESSCCCFPRELVSDMLVSDMKRKMYLNWEVQQQILIHVDCMGLTFIYH